MTYLTVRDYRLQHWRQSACVLWSGVYNEQMVKISVRERESKDSPRSRERPAPMRQSLVVMAGPGVDFRGEDLEETMGS